MSKKLGKRSSKRDLARLRRRKQVRKRVFGTTEVPRLCVFRSNRHIYAQIVDDTKGTTLAAVSTLSEQVRTQLEGKDKKDSARFIGAEIAKLCLDKKIENIVFDRGGFLYKGGRVKALAEGARKAGLKF